MGRPLKHWQCVPGTCGYEFDYAYNKLGGITSSFDSATAITLGQSYDAAGRVTSITSSFVDAYHPATLVTANSYWPTGPEQNLTLGNGLFQATLYEPRLQECRISLYSSGTPPAGCPSSVASGNIQDYGYVFGGWGSSDNGNITYWSGLGSQWWGRTYTYDNLNRLSSLSDPTSTNPCPGLTWSYDALGNRTAQTVTSGSCGAWSASYDVHNHITSTGFSYDAAGNLTNDGSHSYAYDAENHLISVDGGTIAAYVYDAEGRRVQKSAGGIATQYLYDLLGNVVVDYQAGGWSEIYVYLNNQLLSQYSGGTTYFAFQDHLGSTRVLTDMSGSVADSMDFAPFGEQIVGGSVTSHKFTGQERDSESTPNLDNFIARYFNSAEGRFMSPDPLGGNIGDPQSQNRYAYVRNNPLTFTDPTGMDVCEFGCGGFGIGLPCLEFCGGGGGGNDRQPPINSPADPGVNPNPAAGAGDPDPDGPFSGPIWQEGGPQIPLGNWGFLLGKPDPQSPIIFNATEQSNASDDFETFSNGRLFIAGAGDFLSFGLAQRFRRHFGYDSVVNEDSGAYMKGVIRESALQPLRNCSRGRKLPGGFGDKDSSPWRASRIWILGRSSSHSNKVVDIWRFLQAPMV